MKNIVYKIVDSINNNNIDVRLIKLIKELEIDLKIKETLIQSLNELIKLRMEYKNNQKDYLKTKKIYFIKEKELMTISIQYLSLSNSEYDINTLFKIKMCIVKADEELIKLEKIFQKKELDYLELGNYYFEEKQQLIDDLNKLLVKTR